MLQDMKKAFDLVNLEMLDLAIRRIKLLVKIREFILDLYKDRRVEVITA